MRHPDEPFTTLRGHSLRTHPDELRFMIETIEANGYVVRRPSEADLETVLEVECPENYGYEIGIRLDTVFNGTPYALLRRFPFEILLNQDNADFRENHLPKIFAREMAHYIADRMMSGIAAQVEKKINPLVPEKRMTLDEIVSFIAEAIGTTKHRVDPRNFDERDERRKP